MLPPLVADNGGDVTSLSLGGGKVNHQDPLHLERGLAMVQLDQLGFNGRLLTGEFGSPLHGPVPGVDLLSVGFRLMPLRLEPSTWPWYGSLQWDRCNGRRGWSALRPKHGRDGDKRCHHAEFLRGGEARAPPPLEAI
jgi:hypothetical protein